MGSDKTSTRSSFVMYTEYEKSFDLLSDENKGKLISAIFIYVRTREAPDIHGEVKMAFSFIKQTLDRDHTRWMETIIKRVESGRKGGIASGESRKVYDEQK